MFRQLVFYIILAQISTCPISYAQEVHPIFQVFVEEFGTIDEEEVSLFVTIEETSSGKLFWTSDSNLDASKHRFEELLEKPETLQFEIKTTVLHGLLEFELNLADIMPPDNWYKKQVGVRGLIKGSNGVLFPFSALIVPVPLSVRSLRAETVAESAISSSAIVDELRRRNDYLKRQYSDNQRDIIELKDSKQKLIESMERLRLDLDRLQDSLAQDNYDPTISITGSQEGEVSLTEVMMRPWQYLRGNIQIPRYVSEDHEVSFINRNDVQFDPDDPNNIPAEAYNTYVIFSDNPSNVRVNLGQWESDSETSLTFQAGGLPGVANVFLLRLDNYINHFNTEPILRSALEPKITFYVDVSRGSTHESYAFVTNDPNGYTLDGERWGGAVDGNGTQSLFFGNASKYEDKVRTNGDSEDFTYQYVIFSTADPDANYADGSQTNYVSKAIQQIADAHDPSLVDITPEEFYDQTSYGNSSLQSALVSPLIVDLSAEVLLPEELREEVQDSEGNNVQDSEGNNVVLEASRSGWKFADLEFNFMENHYPVQTKSVGVDIGNFQRWKDNNRPAVELKLKTTETDAEGNETTVYSSPVDGFFAMKYMETLRLVADLAITEVYVTQETYPDTLGELRVGDNENWQNYSSFIEFLPEKSKIENKGDEDLSLFDIVGDFQPIAEPSGGSPDITSPFYIPPAAPNLNIYLHCKPRGIPEDRVIVFTASIKLEYRTHNWGRSSMTNLALKEIVNKQINSAGIDAQSVDCQIWLFPDIIGANTTTNIVWATGGNYISAGSHFFGNADVFSKLMIHEMGHTIQKFSDHYWAKKYNHSDAHKGRAVQYYDMMSKQGLYSDHIMASKVSRNWLPSDRIAVFNPMLIEGDVGRSSNLVVTNRYKLANMNNLNLQDTLDSNAQLHAGLEIRLADGNNLTVEYRATNTNGFKLNPYITNQVIHGLDAEANYAYTTNMRNPPEHFKILETWGNLGNGHNTYNAVRSGLAQPPVLLAPSDFDTVPTNLHTNNVWTVEKLRELDSDEAWSRRSYPLLKSDGPFLIPSKPDQELILDNISEDQLLERLQIKTEAQFDVNHGEIELIYERYNRSELLNRGADPSILPQEQCCSWQSADIEVVNAKSLNNAAWKNLPWPKHDNQIKVTIRNNTTIPAPNVRVQLRVMNWQVEANSRHWANVSSKAIDLAADSSGTLIWEPEETRGIFAVGENDRDSQSYHKCIQAKILPWSGQMELEGEVFVFEEQGPALSNNIAESNYTYKKSQAASPAEIVTVPVSLHNDYDHPLQISLYAWPNHQNFTVFNPEPVFTMTPFSTKTVDVGIQYAPRVDPNSKVPIKNGYISFSAYAEGPATVELGVKGGPHDDDILMGGAIAKIFGGRRVNLTLAERSKVLSGAFFDPDGSPIPNGGKVSVYLGTGIDAQVMSTMLDAQGEFRFEGNEFMRNILITLDPEESLEFGFFEQEFPPVP